MAYSPFELPANTAAFDMFVDANPDAVDPGRTLEPERQNQAVAHIQQHIDTMAAAGVTVNDRRLSGPLPSRATWDDPNATWNDSTFSWSGAPI